MSLRLVFDSDWEQAAIEQQQRELRLTLLQVAIGAMDTVLESLPDTGMTALWMADAIELAQRVKGRIDG